MTITLDARKMTEKSEAQKYLREQFSMPDYYGHNLDALYDCLTERDETDIVLTHLTPGATYARRVLRVLLDATRSNPQLTLQVVDEEPAGFGSKRRSTYLGSAVTNVMEDGIDAR